MPIKYGSLPFNKAVESFRDKLNMPTATWTGIWQGQHARAFVIAGAMKEDLLTDLRGSVDKVIADGISLEDFRKDFDKIVQKHGWGYNGGRNWRTRVIYETNLYQSHNAGRYAQMQQVKRTRPFWRYRHNDSVEHPREEHLAWDGKILSADDPWWDTHYPANGWGCKCFIQTLSQRDMDKLGKSKPDQAPPIELEEKTVGVKGPSPFTVSVPKGIDPGFAYNPGKSAFGEQLSDNVMSEWRKTKDKWLPLDVSNWRDAGRTENIPMATPPVKLASRVKTKQQVLELMQKQQGDQKLYSAKGIPVLVNSKSLSEHIDPNRSEFIPLLDDVLTNPHEIWQSFERHSASGKIVLRTRFIKGYEIGKGRFVLVSADAKKGYFQGWTFLPTSKKNYIQNQRVGKLIFGEE